MSTSIDATNALTFAEAPAETAPRTTDLPGGVTGAPRLLLRAEGALVLVAAVVAFRSLGGSWAVFAALFLVPDLSLFGYLVGRRAGAIAYNTAHSYLAPGALALTGIWFPAVLPFAAIWVAHVGFDRMLGYGLKYASAFGDTHLGRVGRTSAQAR